MNVDYGKIFVLDCCRAEYSILESISLNTKSKEPKYLILLEREEFKSKSLTQ